MLTNDELQHPTISRELQLAEAAFNRDLPMLLEQGYAGQWVAYIGPNRRELAMRKSQLLDRYQAEVRDGEALIARIEEQPEFESLGIF